MARALLYQAPMRTIRARRERGFTLVELAIVVVIVGVLAVIAVVAYRKMIVNAKTAEAQNVIGAIKIAQQDFFAERGTYADIGNNFCPAAQACPTCLGNKKTQWDSQCAGGVNSWSLLAVHVADPVLFGYRVRGGPAWAADLLGVGWVSWAGMPAGRPFFEIHAMADANNDGAPYTEFATSSSTNQIFGNNVGE